jgi:hypothetical protein
MNENPIISPVARKHILFALKLAAVMIGTGLLLTLTRKLGLVDGELVMRANNVVLGLALATYFNAMPKMLEPPPRSIRDATVRQAVGRVSSWAMTLALLVWATLWAFAPQGFAKIGSIAAVGTSLVVMLGYTMWKYVNCRTSGNESERP